MNQVESLVQVEDGRKLKTTYLYGKPENQQVPGLSYGLQADGVTKQEFTYDSLGRRTEEKLHIGTGSPRCIQYSYENSGQVTLKFYKYKSYYLI